MTDTCPIRLLELDAKIQDKLEKKNKGKRKKTPPINYEAARIKTLTDYYEKTGLLMLG